MFRTRLQWIWREWEERLEKSSLKPQRWEKDDGIISGGGRQIESVFHSFKLTSYVHVDSTSLHAVHIVRGEILELNK